MECPVCLDPFTDPVVLPCGHTLCRNTCARGLIKDDCLKCPTCRTVHWVPEGGEGLPRNYALQEYMDNPSDAHGEEGPVCPDHPGVNTSMLCLQCHEPVCVKCCLGPSDEPKPKHFQHEVTPGDNVSAHIQSMSSYATEYLQSRRDEVLGRFKQLAEATLHQQNLLVEGRSYIQEEKERLARLLEDQSQFLLDQMQMFVAESNLPHQSQAVLQQALEYKLLEDQCQAFAGNEGAMERTCVWQKYEDFRRLLEKIDRLPYTNDQPVSHQFLTAGKFTLNTDNLQMAIQRTLALDTQPPEPPQFSLEDCVFGDTSAAIAWTFSSDDHVNYFTVYYVTAIFVRGLCNDCQSFDVMDFGQTKAQTTIRGLQGNHRYRLHVVARNSAGESKRSPVLYFKANNAESDVKIID